MRMSALAAVLGFAAAPLAAEPFTFVALGDVPYGDPAEVYPPFETLIGTINDAEPTLVIHVGDTKSGSTLCSDAMLMDQLNFINTFNAPVLYTPGDNEWTDCYRAKAGEFDPIERLAFIRTNYFVDPSQSLGSTRVSVESQADAGYPENMRMMQGDVMFVTAHVVGSNNNFETRDMAAVQEFMARDAANLTWLEDSFAAAAGAEALVLAIHADMFEFDFDSFGNQNWLRHSGFNSFGPALKTAAANFGKPVLLIYGDSHVFRQMRPFPKDAPNLMSLEVPGSKDMHAVEVSVDTATSGVFSVSLITNPALSN